MSVPKVIAGVVFNVAFFALLLFVPAGTLALVAGMGVFGRYCDRDDRSRLQYFAR